MRSSEGEKRDGLGRKREVYRKVRRKKTEESEYDGAWVAGVGDGGME